VGGWERTAGAVELAHRRDEVVATVGVHPHDASTLDASLDSRLRELARDERVVAVGEVGLDYHYQHSPQAVQKQVFSHFVQVARELRKPLVVHTREAAADTLEILESGPARDVGGVIHCFGEGRAFAKRVLDLGFFVSFSGIVTFKNAESLREVAAWAPADRILIETDSPYLAPVPLRGKRCEPAYVLHTARRVAELRGVSLQEIEATTAQNAGRLFGAPLAAAVQAASVEPGSALAT
jgi:TatD DNase family protein